MRENSIRENREILKSPEDSQSGRPGKAKSRNPGMNDLRKSDGPIVPTNSPNKERPGSAEAREGRGPAKGNASANRMPWTLSQMSASPGLIRVRQAAQRQPRVCFTSLLHHVTVQLLQESYLRLNPKAVRGVDKTSWSDYGLNLQENLRKLHDSIHRGTYRPLPSKRVYIPKANGKLRPIGIASLQDKIVQGALVAVLNGIYECDFRGFSYGFRPKRSQHDALDSLVVGLAESGVNYVLDADISGFFDNIDQDWMDKFLRHRVKDERVLRIIRMWLKAGISEDGNWTESETGTPQGSVISPLLANIYLHYVLDLWAEYWRKTKVAGRMVIVRYADDFVIGFSNVKDALRFKRELAERFRKFSLELHPDKTRLIKFGARIYNRMRQRRKRGKPKTFNFLGFTFFCTKASTGHFQIGRKTTRQRMTLKLKEIGKLLKWNRHKPLSEQGKWLRRVVNGYFNYHAIPGNRDALWRFRKAVGRLWFTALRRRSQRHGMNWEKMGKLIKAFVPKAKIKHPNPFERFNAKYPR